MNQLVSCLSMNRGAATKDCHSPQQCVNAGCSACLSSARSHGVLGDVTLMMEGKWSVTGAHTVQFPI